MEIAAQSQETPNKYPKKRRLLRCLVGIVFVLAALFCVIQLRINWYAAPYLVNIETAPEADAVLVLGAKVYADGTPSPTLQDRLDAGYQLYLTGKVKKILVSGDHGQADYNEVEVMKNYLLAKGVPREDIFMDHAGFDTYDSMYRARDVFEVESVIISTQQFHINRSVYIARRLGLDAYGLPSPDREQGRIYNNLRESLAKIKAFFDIEIFHREPRVLGDVIPISGDGIVTEGLGPSAPAGTEHLWALENLSEFTRKFLKKAGDKLLNI